MRITTPKRSIDIQPDSLTRQRLEADIAYLERIIDACEKENPVRARVLKPVVNDFKEAIRDYIYFNERGTALKKIKEVDTLCRYGETIDSISSLATD